MKWFSKLFHNPNLIKIEDDVFGKLTLVEFRKEKKNYWEATGIFKPDNSEILFLVATEGRLPPSKGQKEFLNEIYSKLSDLKKIWSQKLELELKNWDKEIQIDSDNFDYYFKVNSIRIPRTFDNDTTWEIGFDSPNFDPYHVYTVVMKGWKPWKTYFDG